MPPSTSTTSNSPGPSSVLGPNTSSIITSRSSPLAAPVSSRTRRGPGVLGTTTICRPGDPLAERSSSRPDCCVPLPAICHHPQPLGGRTGTRFATSWPRGWAPDKGRWAPRPRGASADEAHVHDQRTLQGRSCCSERDSDPTRPRLVRVVVHGPLPHHQHLAHAPAVGRLDRQAQAVEADLVARAGHAADPVVDEAADRVVLVLVLERAASCPRGPAGRRSRRARPRGPGPRPACSTSGSSSSYSSWISPTISSSRSSIVTRPAVPPYSSSTIAMWTLRRWNSWSRSSMDIDSGTNTGVRSMSSAGSTGRRHRT